MKRSVWLLMLVASVFGLAPAAFAEEKTMEEQVKALYGVLGGLTVYGSIRMATFYWDNTDGDDEAEGALSDDKGTQWDLQGNTRLGVKLQKGSLGGKFEIGLDDDGTKVATRHAYGTYTVNDFTLLVGQTWPILGDIVYSNQVYGEDWDLQDWGFPDEARTPLVRLSYRGFDVDFVETQDPSLGGAPDDASYEVLLPHVEAKYHLGFDTFFVDVFGGAGTLKIKSDSQDLDEGVNGYAFGVGAGLTMAPVSVSALGWMGRNAVTFGMIQIDAVGAQVDADGSIVDEKGWGVGVVASTVVGEVTLEAGWALTASELDESGDDNNKAQAYYAQAVVPITSVGPAKFHVVPEVGVLDYMKDSAGKKQGKQLYAGAKWQIDF